MLCPYCKSPVSTGDPFCSMCGATLTPAAPRAAVAVRRPSKKTPIIVACAAAAVILILFLIIKSTVAAPWTEHDMFFYSKSSSAPITSWENDSWNGTYIATLEDCTDDYFDAHTFRGVRIGDDAVSALKKYPLAGHAVIYRNGDTFAPIPYTNSSDTKKLIESTSLDNQTVVVAVFLFVYNNGKIECLPSDILSIQEESMLEEALQTYRKKAEDVQTLYLLAFNIEDGKIEDAGSWGLRPDEYTSIPSSLWGLV